MNIVCGHIYAPNGTPIQFESTVAGSLQDHVCVELVSDYYPIPTSFARASWPSGAIPDVVPAGTQLLLPAGEGHALVIAGAARPVISPVRESGAAPSTEAPSAATPGAAPSTEAPSAATPAV